MSRNKIFYVRYIDKKQFKDSLVFEMDGKSVKTREQFFHEVEKCFKFPGHCEGIFARFLDWIDADKLVFIIRNYYNFLDQDKEFKKLVLKRFKDHILPFWEKEVETVVVGGKPKSFNLYLQI